MVTAKKTKKNSASIAWRVWRWVRWPLLVLVIAYIGLVIYRIPAVGEKQKTADTVANIHSSHITLADVLGNNLPPVPYQPENDATVAGIDKNNNGIRDDVELAIFNLHPKEAKVRAAELQYALTEQMFLTDVFNTDTWIAAAQEDSRGYACVSDTSSRSDIQEHLKNTDLLINEVKSLVFNTSLRTQTKDQAYNFTTTYGDLSTAECDIDLNTLPN